MWVPVRKPHENTDEPHWLARGTYVDIPHPEHGTAYRYPASKWISSASPWIPGRRAPLLDEDRATVLAVLARRAASPARVTERAPASQNLSVHGKPFALSGVRVLDFTWMLASAGATRYLAALGADVIKVEWHERLDPRRGGAPVGGREARESATGPVPSRWPADLGGPVGAQYNNKNPGKRAISLNVKHPRGLELAKRLVAACDVVAEGFSPGVMESWGLDYEVLRGIAPDIIYAKQSGMGSRGVYGRFRTVGPVAAAFSGISDMSGLPDPMPPAGWGYSYLDWFGAYSFALAILTAIYHRQRTGQGQWIDASQCEVGVYLTGVPALDWSVNRRVWQRNGNFSPYAPAAPEGIYPSAGEDRWIAITCATEEDWRRLAAEARRPDWPGHPDFATLDARLAHRAALDAAIGSWTARCDAFELTERLQRAGVAAGVAQTAADRVERDPQLRHLNWLTELEATDFGRWPVAETSVKMSATPQHIGGPVDRAAPTYGEHNAEVYQRMLGLSPAEMAELAAAGAI
jgi:crotonobetainyl-CoA:carnitine CoA-transferase CaiB-like acyl-CoA transferase